jgi:hypothetical protein
MMSRRIFLAVALVMLTDVAIACSCVRTLGSLELDVERFWSFSTAVVIAEAIETENVRANDFQLREEEIQTQKVVWRVTRQWKGPHGVGSVFVTETDVTCCKCGGTVSIGDTLLLYLQNDEPYEVTICSPGQTPKDSGPQVPILDRLRREHRVRSGT